MIAASRFDPAAAYAAVDRHRLDDQKPYVYRTRDYGKTWQPITTGIGAHSFVNAIREDTQNQGLLFAGTELGIYVSFDDGDDWQPLQLNLPVTSVRDVTIHGDDLVIASYGARSGYWTTSRHCVRSTSRRRRQPSCSTNQATAIRIDNDVFLGSPLAAGRGLRRTTRRTAPSWTTTCLPAAKEVQLEILDGSGSWCDVFRSGPRKEEKTSSLVHR